MKLAQRTSLALGLGLWLTASAEILPQPQQLGPHSCRQSENSQPRRQPKRRKPGASCGKNAKRLPLPMQIN